MKPTCLILTTAKTCHKVFNFQRSSLQTFQTFVKGHPHFSKRRLIDNFLLPWVYYSKAPNDLNTATSQILGSQLFNHKNSVKAQFIEAFILLRDSGVETQAIYKYYNMLQDDDSYIKASCLVKIKENPTELLSLLKLPLATLRATAKQFEKDKGQISGFKDRMSYLQHQLEVDHDKLIDLVMKHPILLMLPFSRLSVKMQILKNAQIDVKYIVRDLWIFNYTETLLSERTQAVQCTGILLKPWHLRCSKKFFDIWLSKGKETQSILQGENQLSYLARRLECSEDYVKHMMERNIYLPNTNVRKLKKLLDFLFRKGYTAEEIRLFPKVFCASVETLQKRFEKLLEVKGTMPTVPQISLRSNFNNALKATNINCIETSSQ